MATRSATTEIDAKPILAHTGLLTPASGKSPSGNDTQHAWNTESPENEVIFWRNIYPRLLPSSVNVLALQQQRQREAVPWPTKREEIIQGLERLAGPEARQLFERFEAEVEMLEQQNRARLRPPLKMVQATAS